MTYIFQLNRDKEQDEPVKSFRTKMTLEDLNQKNETPFEFINIEVGISNNRDFWCCAFIADCQVLVTLVNLD